MKATLKFFDDHPWLRVVLNGKTLMIDYDQKHRELGFIIANGIDSTITLPAGDGRAEPVEVENATAAPELLELYDRFVIRADEPDAQDGEVFSG